MSSSWFSWLVEILNQKLELFAACLRISIWSLIPVSQGAFIWEGVEDFLGFREIPMLLLDVIVVAASRIV
jgi:hypothetical protein